MGTNKASILNRLLNVKITTANRLERQAEVKALTTTITNHLRSGSLGKAVSVLFAAPLPFPSSLYAHLFRTCASNKAAVELRKVESHLVTFSPNPPLFLLNRAIEAYGKCACLRDAQEVFDELPQRDGGSWNAMITAYSQNGYAERGLEMFLCMRKSGVSASEITFASVLVSCASLLNVWILRQVHALIVKFGFSGNVILETSLVDAYGKCQEMDDARRMFDEIENPNNVSWNVIIRRYLDMDAGKDVVSLFSELVRANVVPLTFTVSNALVACLTIGALTEGLQIHGFSIKINAEMDKVVSNSLIDLYRKCGDLVSARRIFDLICSKDLIHWTSMVSGYAMDGKTREARDLFNEMPEKSVISWNAMLAVYVHNSEWDEALQLIFLMCKQTRDIDHVTLGLILNVSAALSDIELGKQVHGFMYRHKLHSNLFVANALLDVYGKCGHLRKTRVLFHEMSQWRDAVSWNALLTSYNFHRMGDTTMMNFSNMLGGTIPSKYTFGTLLAACANTFALKPGKQIHGYIIRNDYEMDIVINGALVNMYSKCGCVDYALDIFAAAPQKDLFLWNSLMLACYHNRRGDYVFKLFESMKETGISPDSTTFQAIFLVCIREGHVQLGRQYFDLMSDKYWITPWLEHYESMIELFGQHGYFDELEDFMKKLPFSPTIQMLERVAHFCREQRNLKLESWAINQRNQIFSKNCSEIAE
nr:pentatricopeptide repeat-containing protein At3g26540 [Ipomoea batatas]